MVTMLAMRAATKASKSALGSGGGTFSTAAASGVDLKASGAPVVDMIEVIDAIRSG